MNGIFDTSRLKESSRLRKILEDLPIKAIDEKNNLSTFIFDVINEGTVLGKKGYLVIPKNGRVTIYETIEEKRGEIDLISSSIIKNKYLGLLFRDRRFILYYQPIEEV